MFWYFSVQIRNFFWSIFYRIYIEQALRNSPDTEKNGPEKKSVFGYFWCSVIVFETLNIYNHIKEDNCRIFLSKRFNECFQKNKMDIQELFTDWMEINLMRLKVNPQEFL